MALTDRQQSLIAANPELANALTRVQSGKLQVRSPLSLSALQPVKPRTKKSRGVGDTIAKATTALGIQPCPSCKERIAWLNSVLPYKVEESSGEA